jgi:glycosyltransferase involved in cell wall biosynthesis
VSTGLEKLVYIGLATYEPNLTFLKEQLESIQRQTYPHWTCVIQDDGSQCFKEIQSLIAADSRFTLKRNHVQRGVYENFETLLYHVPREATYIAFCDQDDIWEKDKLEIEISALEKSQAVLAHSDLTVINDKGEVIHPSCWQLEKRNPKVHLPRLFLLRNTVTGCTAVFHRKLLEDLLPFPWQQKNVVYLHNL